MRECDIGMGSEELSQSFDYDEELESCDGSELDKDDEIFKENLLPTQNCSENELSRSFDYYDAVSESYDSSQSGESIGINEQHLLIARGGKSIEANSTDDSAVTTNNEIGYILKRKQADIDEINSYTSSEEDYDGDDDDNQNEPNKLCERLRLLLTTNFAENSNSDQEIRIIISELRDGGFID